MERHFKLKQLAHRLYLFPGIKSAIHRCTRLIIQHSLVSLKSRQRLYNFFAKDTLPPQPVVFNVIIPVQTPKKFLSLRLDLHDDLSRMWYYWSYTGYEPEVTRFFCTLLQHKRNIFDIGANIGYYTLLAAALSEGRGQVHAFEPWPVVYDCLSYNIQLNNLKNLHLNVLAMSDQDGTEKLLLPSNMAWTNASLISGFTHQEKSIEVPTVRFDTYCETHHIESVDLVKIDVEGAEIKVLRGMGALLQRWQPDIICEVLQSYAPQLEAFFRDTPYHKFLITRDGLIEVDTISAHSQFRDYYLSCRPLIDLL